MLPCLVEKQPSKKLLLTNVQRQMTLGALDGVTGRIWREAKSGAFS